PPALSFALHSLRCSSFSARLAFRTRSCALSSSVLLNHPATPDIYTLSLHDALPISTSTNLAVYFQNSVVIAVPATVAPLVLAIIDRKSTRLNSSHVSISYAVFCLKNKRKSRRSCTGARHEYHALLSPDDRCVNNSDW